MLARSSGCTYTVIISQGSQTFYPTHSPVGCLPWEWYRYMPESVIRMAGLSTRWIAALSAAPRPCARIGTLTLVGPPLEFLPYHRNDRFPRFTHEPSSGRATFNAERRTSSIQVSPGLLLVFVSYQF